MLYVFYLDTSVKPKYDGEFMHIINIMFSCGLGGIEQASIDYCEAIKAQGHKVTAVIHPDAKVRKGLEPLGVNIINVKNLGSWDIFAKAYLKKIFKQVKPDAIIVHGNRAISLTKSVAKALSIPIIGVTHNYKIKRLVGLDAIFAITDDLRAKMIAAGQAENTIYRIPNMIRVAPLPPFAPRKNPVVIGTMGRFVQKKGFDVFIRAIAKLHSGGIAIKAVIGGGGEEESALKELTNQLGLNDIIEFSGWVTDKEKFFRDIDIFCLPSKHEPFGIILLEAFMSGKPVVAAASEGPSEIAHDGIDALMVPVGDRDAMAAAIIQLVNDAALGERLAAAAYETVKGYDMGSVGGRMSEVLGEIVAAATVIPEARTL
jgi:glycosyltransferase involved in cell wall biosynthesis